MSVRNRAEVFVALAELAHHYPHWRVGQLVANVAGWADTEVWDAEDEQLLSAMRAHLSGTSNGELEHCPPIARSEGDRAVR